MLGREKTTLVKSLVKTLNSLKQKSVLLAPTGRAAKVLTAYSGHPAWTIHKKIYRQKAGSDGLGEFVLDRNLHKNTCFIVDEASMIGDRSPDAFFGSGDLLRDLVDYVEAGSQCRLILVGDTAQLPPVGLDMSPALNPERLESFAYRVREIELTDVVRQAEDSGILHNATFIRNLITDGLAEYPQFNFDSFPDITLISGSELLECISSSYDRYGSSDTIVVTRSNKRANKFNAGIRSQILWREEQLSPGDLLMVVKNNYFWKDEVGFEKAREKALKEGVITREPIQVPVLDSLFHQGFATDSLRYVPFCDGVTFTLTSGKLLTSSNLTVQVVEAFCLYDDLLNAMDRQLVVNYKDERMKIVGFEGVKFGSMEEGTLTGNWE